ncbi:MULTISPECIES: helix-turn-helix domain-containing protein [unclassified Paenibacillus]|uniref:Helix-turn-helix domain-containing protein n=3 Tax=Bacillati TaxID=1783272 RepID=A0ABW3Q3G8_9BACL|nr:MULTISPECIES: helix-turn-helix transcriptional regulator [unclassified Paenibacillus]MCM3130133.1 helix-turn-helix domain-containing protein [Paenibacillus sp. MER 78]SDX70254.1 Transcriptional regulator, contains XRE-family HTH domain [Paenibacillus sp. PDC88]SFS88007.1 Transcriptional regulator, contains XRE-family HTH domain [Paenibacillus sp. 453mf]
MFEYDTILDPEIIGKNIRRIRKSKKITIIQLSQVLGYATGKLSNIEKGKRAKFPYEELVQIANALNEPVEVFLADESDSFSDELESLKQAISFAKHKLSAGLLHGLNETLDELQQRAEKIPNNKMLIHLHFVWAEYYRDVSDLDLAQDYYRETISAAESSDCDIVELKMRSFNGLASLLVKEQKLFEAIEVLREALNYADKNTEVLSLDYSNVHFNLTIIYLHIGYLDLAQYHVHSCMEITKGKNEQAYYHASYLLSITYWIRGRYQKAKTLLLDSMNWFQRQKDLSSLFNSLELIFILHKVRPGILFQYMFSDLKEFFQLNVPSNIIPQKLKCLYRLIEIEIKNDNYEDAREMIETCKKYIDIHGIQNGFRAYELDALLISKTTQDIFQEQVALEKALDFFSIEDKSPEKAVLLYRLGRLNSVRMNPLIDEALTIFEETHSEKNYLECSLLTILPQPRY